jgi:hypothetical protein
MHYNEPEDPRKKKDEDKKKLMRELRKEVEADMAAGINPEEEAEEKERNNFPRTRHGDIIYDDLNEEESEAAYTEELIDEAVRTHNAPIEKFQIRTMERAAEFITNMGNTPGNMFSEFVQHEIKNRRYYKKQIREEILVTRSLSTGSKSELFKPLVKPRFELTTEFEKGIEKQAVDRLDKILENERDKRENAKLNAANPAPGDTKKEVVPIPKEDAGNTPTTTLDDHIALGATTLNQQSESVNAPSAMKSVPVAKPNASIAPETTPIKKESEPVNTTSTVKSTPVAKSEAINVPKEAPHNQEYEPANASSAVEDTPIQKSKSLSNIRGIPYDTLVKYTMIVEKAKFNNIIEIKDNGRIGEMILTEKLELSPNEIRALHAVQFLFAVAGNKDRLIEEIPNLFAKDDGIDTLPTLYYKKSEYYEAYGLKKNKNKWNSRSVKIVQDALISLSNKLITYTINYADGEKISINNANLLILGDYKPSSTKKFDTVSLSSFMLLRENKWFGRVGRDVYEKLDNLINVNGRDRYYRLLDELKIVAGNLVNVDKQEFETTITKVRLLDITKISKQNDKIGKDKNLKTLHTCLDNLVKAKILTAWKTLTTGSYKLYLNDKVFYRPSIKHSI